MQKTRREQIKRLYEKNQACLDKAVLSISLAMPPIMGFLYEKLSPNTTLAFFLFISCSSLFCITVISYLMGFITAKNGCSYQDTAETQKNKDKENYKKRATNCYNFADVLEVIQMASIIFAFILLPIFLYSATTSTNSTTTTKISIVIEEK